MYKTHKIVLIPTDKKEFKKGQIILTLGPLINFKGEVLKHENTLYLSSNDSIDIVTHPLQPQHLYILSDEELKEGDWFIQYDSALAPNKITEYHLEIIKDGIHGKDWKKIIATTDRSLVVNVSKSLGVTRELPNIPLKFVKQYIEKYNQRKQIKKVLVEYVDDYSKNDQLIIMENEGIDIRSPYQKIKIHENNYVSVKPKKIKKYKRKEVIKIMKKFKEETELFSTSSIVKENKSVMTIEQIENKWIEENL